MRVWPVRTPGQATPAAHARVPSQGPYALACAALCLALAACGSATEATSAGPPARTPASPLVKVERDLKREMGLGMPECTRLPHAPASSRFRCFVESEGVEMRLSVTQSDGARRPLVTDCDAVRQKKDQFVTCAVRQRR
jgi:hypothetical protein